MANPHIISVSEFKAHCLQYLNQVNQDHVPLSITKRGKPLVIVFPSTDKKNTQFAFGKMRGTATITGDLLAPIDIDWEKNL